MASGIQQRCSPKYMTVMRIYVLLPALLLGAAGIFAGSLPFRLRMAALFAAAFCCIAAVVLVPAYYLSMSYTRRGQSIRIERGLIFRRTAILGSRQVRYIFVRRTIIERMFGLCTLVFATPAGQVSLSGLSKEDALRIRRVFGAA